MAPAASAFPSTHMTVTTVHSPIRTGYSHLQASKLKQNHPMSSLLQDKDKIQRQSLSLALQEGCCAEQEPTQPTVGGQSTHVLRCEAEAVLEIGNKANKTQKKPESQLLIRPPNYSV